MKITEQKRALLVVSIAVIVLFALEGNVIAQTNTFPSNGNAGIGTTTPQTKLDIASELTTGSDGITISQHVNTGGQPTVYFRRARGTLAAPTAVDLNRVLGQMFFLGYDGSAFGLGAIIDSRAAGTFTTTDHSSTLRFHTTLNLTPFERMRIDQFGNVAIGTASPASPFHVFKDWDGSASTNLLSTLDAYDDQSRLVIRRANGNAGAESQVLSGQNLGGLQFRGWHSGGAFSTNSSASVTAVAAENFTSTGVGSSLQFTTTAIGSTTPAVRMAVDSSGNVGVGTTTPSVLMDLKSNNVAYGGQLRLQATDYSQITFYNSNNPTLNAANRLGSMYYDIANTRMNLDNHSGTKYIVLNAESAGNVGIGTFNPAYKLDVNGTINGTNVLINGSPVVGSQWTTSGTNIHYGSGNVGIGNASPGSKLFVGSGTPAVTTLAGLNVALGSASYVSASNGTENIFMGADGSGYGILGTLSNHSLGFRTNNVERVRIDTSGNVGVGTTSPTAKLHVAGDGKVTGNLTVDGNIAAKYQDLAEWVPAAHALPPGTVVTLNETQANLVEASSKPYDTRVAGVISEQPGIALGERGENKVLVATTGRVRIKVDATKAPIRIGDLLVTSEKEGVAMKSEPINFNGVEIHRPGTIIGKALESLAQGTGEILVLLSLQ